MAFPISPLAGVISDNTEDTQRFALGTEVQFNDGSKRMYVKSGGNITNASLLHIDATFKAKMVTDTLAKSSGRIGLAVHTVTASDLYFWAATAWVNLPLRVLGSCAANVQLFTTGTAGALDDATASTSQLQVMGVVLASANPSATATSKNSSSMGEPIIRRIEI